MKYIIVGKSKDLCKAFVEKWKMGNDAELCVGPQSLTGVSGKTIILMDDSAQRVDWWEIHKALDLISGKIGNHIISESQIEVLGGTVIDFLKRAYPSETDKSSKGNNGTGDWTKERIERYRQETNAVVGDLHNRPEANRNDLTDAASRLISALTEIERLQDEASWNAKIFHDLDNLVRNCGFEVVYQEGKVWLQNNTTIFFPDRSKTHE